jgi:hypothetical protein
VFNDLTIPFDHLNGGREIGHYVARRELRHLVPEVASPGD